MLVYFAVCAALTLALYGAYRWWARGVEAEIADGAAVEWARLQRQDPDLLKGLDEARFRAIYRRAEFPRRPGYALACIATFLLGGPVVFAAVSLLAWGVDLVTPDPSVVASRVSVDDGVLKFLDAPPQTADYYVQNLGGFVYLGGLLAAWLVIVAFWARRYYKTAPGPLRDEILRAR